VRLTGLESLELRNLRSGEAGRAVRIFPDGSFDAYVALLPGANPVELVATVEGGRQVELRRTLSYRRPEHPSEAHHSTPTAQ